MAWAGGGPPRLVSEAHEGFFLLRLRKGAMPVPARIMRLPDGQWQATINGRPIDPYTKDTLRPNHDWVYADWVDRILEGGRYVTEAIYASWLERALRASGDDPAANPGRKVDLRNMRSLF